MIFIALVLLIEYMTTKPHVLRAFGCLINVPKSNEERQEDERLDEDVKIEQNRIKSTPIKDNKDTVVLNQLRKIYKGSRKGDVAVKDLSFGVPQGEIFGFLGVNGAGKTTTLAVIISYLYHFNISFSFLFFLILCVCVFCKKQNEKDNDMNVKKKKKSVCRGKDLHRQGQVISMAMTLLIKLQ